MGKNNILNNDRIKNKNRLAVLDLLKDRGAMSRSELTGQLNCDGTTITNIIRSLDNDGFIKSLGCKAESGRGRPKELIALNEDARAAIGISFSPRLLSGVVTNFSGRIIFQEKIYLEKSISRNVLEKRLKQMAMNLLEQCRPRRIAGIGLATFGVYMPESKTIARAEYFDAICGINFENLFHSEFDIVPDIIDGTTARGIAESWARRSAMPASFILLNADIGIGCFVFTNFQPLLTGKGNYNEFGHMIMNPDGKLCEAGHRGCLETYAAVPAIERNVAEVSGKAKPVFEEIVDRYRKQDKAVVKIVNDSGKWLGIASANLVNIFAPEEIILSGSIAGFGPQYLEVLRQTVNKYAMSEFAANTRFSISGITEEGPALGAALIQLDKLFKPD